MCIVRVYPIRYSSGSQQHNKRQRTLEVLVRSWWEYGQLDFAAVNVNIPNRHGCTPLRFVCHVGNGYALLEELLKRGVEVDVNCQDQKGNIRMVKLLLLSHPSVTVSIRNHDGKTAKEISARHCKKMREIDQREATTQSS